MNKQPKVLLMWVPNSVDVRVPHVSSQLNCPVVHFSGATLVFRKSEYQKTSVRGEYGNVKINDTHS